MSFYWSYTLLLRATHSYVLLIYILHNIRFVLHKQE